MSKSRLLVDKYYLQHLHDIMLKLILRVYIVSSFRQKMEKKLFRDCNLSTIKPYINVVTS